MIGLSTETLLVFTLAAVLMNLSPGPSNLYVLARSMQGGFGAGLVAALGLATGSLVHVAAAVLGLAAVLAVSPLAYDLLRVLGALWLGWLAWQAFTGEVQSTGPVAAPPRPRWRVFIESLLVEVTNPKTALFFLAFLPQFADAASGSLATQLLLLGVIVTLTALPCDLFVAALGSGGAAWLARHQGWQRWQARLSGSVLAGLGAWVLVDVAAGD